MRQNLNLIPSKLEMNVMCSRCGRGMAEESPKLNANYWLLNVFTLTKTNRKNSDNKIMVSSQVWLMLTIPALRKLSQEDHCKFKASLNNKAEFYRVGQMRLSLKKAKNKSKIRVGIIFFQFCLCVSWIINSFSTCTQRTLFKYKTNF